MPGGGWHFPPAEEALGLTTDFAVEGTSESETKLCEVALCAFSAVGNARGKEEQHGGPK